MSLSKQVGKNKFVILSVAEKFLVRCLTGKNARQGAPWRACPTVLECASSLALLAWAQACLRPGKRRQAVALQRGDAYDK